MTSKISHGELVEEVSGNFHTYLKKGVRFGSLFGENIPDLKIRNLEELLGIYFVLISEDEFESIEEEADESSKIPSVGVVEFIEELPKRLQNLPTSTTSVRETTRGRIEGRVDWQQTIESRLRTNPTDTRQFSCATQRKSYSDENNVVLKRLLEHVGEILDILGFALEDEGLEWTGKWREADENLARTFHEDILQNVYVQRIDASDRISDRMLESVANSRHALYREAAELLRYYRRLIRYDVTPRDAKLLLQSLFVTPSEDATEILYELHWIFRLLDCFEDPEFRLIKPKTNNNKIAQWRTDRFQYRMFHDCTGSDGVKFKVANDDVPDSPRVDESVYGYLDRRKTVVDRKQELSEAVFDSSTNRNQWSGEPDIVFEEYTLDGELNGVFVGETKWSRGTQYLKGGIEELLEYLYLVKAEGEYLKTEDDTTLSWLQGGLFTDAVNSASYVSDDVVVLSTDDDLTGDRFQWSG